MAMLDEMLSTLQRVGVTCAICSINSRDVIRSALDTVDLLKYFLLQPEAQARLARHDPTHAPPSLLIRDRTNYAQHGSRKSAVISSTILEPLTAEPDALIFIDDDPAHVRDIGLRLPRAATIHVPRPPAQRVNTVLPPGSLPKGGMGATHCAAVLAWARGEPLPEPSNVGGAQDAAPAASSDAEATGSTSGAAAGSCVFVPKRPTGPLSRRCGTCGAHEMEHSQ